MFVTVLSRIGQCEIRNLNVYTSSRSRLYWDCDESDNEFDLTYQLINAGMCDTGGVSGFPVINLPISSSSSDSNYRLHYDFDDLDMYANSTYLFTVQAKQWQPGSGFVYGTQQGVNFNTSEGKLLILYRLLLKWVHQKLTINIFWVKFIKELKTCVRIILTG